MLGDESEQQLLQKPKLEQQPYGNLYPGPSAGYPDHIKENNIMVSTTRNQFLLTVLERVVLVEVLRHLKHDHENDEKRCLLLEDV